MRMSFRKVPILWASRNTWLPAEPPSRIFQQNIHQEYFFHGFGFFDSYMKGPI